MQHGNDPTLPLDPGHHPELERAALPTTGLAPEQVYPTTPEPAPGPAPGRARPQRRGLGAIGALLLGLLAKGKSLLFMLKALPIFKLLLTSASMIAMVAFEAQRTGIWFAVGFVLMILVHELGHGYAMKRRGIGASWPIFIPFFGAMISMKGLPQNRADEAEIAYGGPLAGTLAALAAAALGFATGSRIFFALGYTGFFLNLFNLTPISPLDGGRIAQAFSRRAWIFGAGILVLMFFVTHAPQLLLISLLALPRLLGRRPSPDERPELEPIEQRTWAARYFGLATFLGVGMYLSGALLGRQ